MNTNNIPDIVDFLLFIIPTILFFLTTFLSFLSIFNKADKGKFLSKKILFSSISYLLSFALFEFIYDTYDITYFFSGFERLFTDSINILFGLILITTIFTTVVNIIQIIINWKNLEKRKEYFNKLKLLSLIIFLIFTFVCLLSTPHSITYSSPPS